MYCIMLLLIIKFVNSLFDLKGFFSNIDYLFVKMYFEIIIIDFYYN